MVDIKAILDNKKTVIVIDDDQIVLNILSQYLQKNDLNVLTFTDPFKATEFMLKMEKDRNAPKVAAIISDFNMPDLNGSDVLALFREVEAFRTIPFFILTGFNEHQIMPHVIDLKLGGVLKKPLMMSTFKHDFLDKIAS